MSINKYIIGQLINFIKDTLRVCKKLYNLEPFVITEELRKELLAVVYSLKRQCSEIERLLKLPPEPSDKILHK